jgi:hypothetical protein
MGFAILIYDSCTAGWRGHNYRLAFSGAAGGKSRAGENDSNGRGDDRAHRKSPGTIRSRKRTLMLEVAAVC